MKQSYFYFLRKLYLASNLSESKQSACYQKDCFFIANDCYVKLYKNFIFTIQVDDIIEG